MSRTGWLGAALVGAPLAFAMISLVWTPWPIATLDIAHRLAPSSIAHPLGTDQLGRDLLSLLMAGGWPAFRVAAVAVLMGVAIGVPLGLVAAAWRGWVEEIVMRLADVLFAFPALILAMLIVAVWGPGEGKTALAIGLFNVPVFARVARAAARSLWARDFILAARLAGKGHGAISIDHVLPNILPVLLPQIAIQLAIGLTAEAALAYLGLGAQPPAVSWGRMLADGQSLVAIAPRLVILPGLALVMAVCGVTLVADALAERAR